MKNRLFRPGKAQFLMTQTQKQAKKEFIDMVRNGEIRRKKTVSCPICVKKRFKPVATNERHGLEVPTTICTVCGLVQINPPFTQESLITFFEKTYRKLYSKSKTPEQLHKEEIFKGKSIKEFISKDFEESIIVEIGAGTGGILEPFADKNKCYAVDFDVEHLKENKHPNIESVQGDISEIIHKNIKADLIIYSDTLDHIPDINQEIIKIKKVLKKNGLLYIRTPGILKSHEKYGLNFLQFLQVGTTYKFTATTMENLLGKHEFSAKKITEDIQSVFIQGGAKPLVNEYEKITSYIQWIEEKYNKRWFNKYYLKYVAIQSIVYCMQLFGVYTLYKKIHLRISR